MCAEMGLETNNRNISADVNDLVATRRFVCFTFPLGYDYHVSENFSSSSLIRNIHARRCNLFGMKNKGLLFLLLSKGKLSYIPVAITPTFPREIGDMCVCWLKQTSQGLRSSDVAGQKFQSITFYQAFRCCVREEGEIVLYFARNCERCLCL